MKIYITGIPGTGKSALVKELKKRGIFAFDIDEVEGLCSWVNKETGGKVFDYTPTRAWLAAHEWVCDSEKLKEFLAKGGELVVSAGVAGNQNTYLDLFDKVFLLQSPKDVLMQRLKTRHISSGENSFGKFEEERDYVLSNFQQFEQDLVSRGALLVDSNKDISEVATTVLHEVNKKSSTL